MRARMEAAQAAVRLAEAVRDFPLGDNGADLEGDGDRARGVAILRGASLRLREVVDELRADPFNANGGE